MVWFPVQANIRSHKVSRLWLHKQEALCVIIVLQGSLTPPKMKPKRAKCTLCLLSFHTLNFNFPNVLT